MKNVIVMMIVLMIVAVRGVLPATARADLSPAYRAEYGRLRAELVSCERESGITGEALPEQPSDGNPVSIPFLARRVEICRSAAARGGQPAQPAAATEEETPSPAAERQPMRDEPREQVVVHRYELSPEDRERLDRGLGIIERLAQAPAEHQPQEQAQQQPAPQAPQAEPPVVENRPAEQPGSPPPGAGPFVPPILPYPEQWVLYDGEIPDGWEEAGWRSSIENSSVEWGAGSERIPRCYLAVEVSGRRMAVVSGGALQVAYVQEGGRIAPVSVLRPGSTGFYIADRPGSQGYRFRCYRPTGRRLALPPDELEVVDGRPRRLVTDFVLALDSWNDAPRMERPHTDRFNPLRVWAYHMPQSAN